MSKINSIKEPIRDGLRKQLEEFLLLTEGLIKTYPLTDTITMLNNLGISDNYIRTYNDNNTHKIYIFINNDSNIFNQINNKLKLYGWLFSNYETIDGDYGNTIEKILNCSHIHSFWVAFVAKYDTVVNNKYIPKFIYHITPKSKLTKILNNGLSPKSYNKLTNYPERVYFILDERPILALTKELFKANKSEFKNKETYSVLKIINFDRINFYKDPESNYSIYTFDNIPPNNIINTYEITFDENGDITKMIKI